MRTGYLKHNSQGRYEIPGVAYFTSGEPIELLVDDLWTKGRIEYSHRDSDYYFIAEDDKKIHGIGGMKAREVN